MIGKPIPRVEDQRFVTGNGQYTDDIRVDGQVHAAFLRSPHAHAALRSIDVSAAQAAPGVIAVLIGQDYLDDGFQGVDHAFDRGIISLQIRSRLERSFGKLIGGRHLTLIHQGR